MNDCLVFELIDNEFVALDGQLMTPEGALESIKQINSFSWDVKVRFITVDELLLSFDRAWRWW